MPTNLHRRLIEPSRVLLAQLQCGIERRYDVCIPYAVQEFVSHDADWFEHVSGASDSLDETLLIAQEKDSLEFTLYLATEILERADQAMACGRITGENLDSLCTVLEGVSHAVCLLWHAHHDRQIRPLDLELQAEVDKFVLLAEQLDKPSDRTQLHQRLFEHIRYQSESGTATHHRYKTANDNAASYCGWLNDAYMKPRDEQGLAAELARFYRLSGTDKLHHIRKH